MKYAYKKGQIADVALIVVILAVFAIMIPIALTMMHGFNSAVKGSSALGVDGKNITDKFDKRMGPVLDYVWLLVLALTTIGVVIGAFVVDTHPAFIIFSLILFLMCLGVGAILANVYAEVEAASAVSAAAAELTIIPFIMKRFVQYIGMVGVLVVIALYSKVKLGGRG